MRLVSCVSLAAALLIPSAAYAQHITVAGWVQRVDAANAAITIRTLATPRTIPVAPNAVIRLNGALSGLNRLPINASVSIVAEKGPDGVLRATQISAESMTREPAAAAPPGAVVRGRIVGIDIPDNTITVRTTAGDYPVPLGTASIYVNGARGSTRDLRMGQTVEVDRSLPTPASTDYVTQTVRVLPANSAGSRNGTSRAGRATGASAATGATGAGLVDRGNLLPGTRHPVVTRTRAYTSTYHRTGTRHTAHARRTSTRSRRYRSRHRTHHVRHTRHHAGTTRSM